MGFEQRAERQGKARSTFNSGLYILSISALGFLQIPQFIPVGTLDGLETQLPQVCVCPLVCFTMVSLAVSLCQNLEELTSFKW